MSHASASEAAHPPAIVMGLTANGLGVVRSLAGLGVEVHGVYTDPDAEIARHSRRLRARYRVRDTHSDTEVMATLLGIRRRVAPEGRMVLIPTDDRFARFVSTHRADLREAFRFRVPPSGIETTFLDKRATIDICRRRAMPIPDSYAPDTIDDVEQQAKVVRFPVIVKPARTDDDAFPGKNAIIASASELLAFYRSRPDLVRRSMFQEVIPSGDGRIVVVCTYSGADGQVLASYSGRKLRQWLPDRGVTCYGVSETLPDLQARTASFLDEIGYVGFAAVEFAEEATTHQYSFIELNARTYYHNQLFADAGIDLSTIGYLEMCGAEPPRGLVQRDGIYWIDLHRDIPSAIVKWRLGQLGLLEWARSAWRATSFANWDPHDPKPFIASLRRLLNHALGRSSGRQVRSPRTITGLLHGHVLGHRR